ncbi:MAG: decaprenyl-phosphate phosphoribosyltransferase [Peptococcaceae bacterium]|nr:decaprenyl-phosphate phosphoribosyltransferase [Peptococcaceae bacterium]
MNRYLKLMRVHHYMKNLLVFAALVCSGQLFVPAKLCAGVLGFFAFCATSSAIYIINDIRDCEKDRRHPTKCRRPIASGAVSVRNAACLAVVLFVLAVLFIAPVFKLSAVLLLLLYIVLNLAYSFGIKNVPIADITVLAAGFVIRVIYGAQLTEIIISNWLYLAVFAMSFYLALGKRRGELIQVTDGDTRSVLKAYPLDFLNRNMTMCLTLGNVFYALWSMDQVTTAFYHNRLLIFTVPIVLLITLKYSLTIDTASDGDPVEVLIHDRALLLLVLLYLAVMLGILYI